MNHIQLAGLASLAIASLTLTACSSPTPTGAASLTAADVSAMPESREPVGPEAAAQRTAVPSDVICRAKDAFGVVNELSITWTSAGGAGFLRRSTPSGMEEQVRVRAERYRDLVIVDAPNEEDLMSHLAVVGRHKGKLHMRVAGTWVPCE